MRYLAAWICVLIFAGVAFARPNLDHFQDIESVRVYADHKKKDIFYLSPAAPELEPDDNGMPGYGLKIYRYLGRKGTGDSDKFWVKGIFSLTIQRQQDAKRLKQIKKKLAKQFQVKYPKLRSMPVEKTHGKLLFADFDIKWSQPGRWSGKQLAIPLGSNISQVLWDAAQSGQTLISIEMEETLSGVRKNKEKKWDNDVVSASHTLPVTLDMAAFPSLFAQTDLGGRMVRGYTGVDIFCFDFIENLDENLYAKIVEVAIPTPKQPLVESATFREDTPYRTRITFKLAKDLDTGYRVRITKVLLNGESIPGPWKMRMGEAMLDITDYQENDSGNDNEDDQADLPEE